jgi:hypothetical protein
MINKILILVVLSLIGNYVFAIDPISDFTAIKPLIDEIPKLVELLQIEHKSLLSDIHREDLGFKNIDNLLIHKKGTTASLDKLFDFWMRKQIINFSNSNTKNLLDTAFEELLNNLVLPKQSNVQHIYNVVYQNSQGKMDVCHISVRKNKYITDFVAYDYKMFVLNINFVPASPYVILTTQDSDLFSSTTVQEIKYLEPNVNDGHFQSLIGFNTMVFDTLSSL